VQLEKVERRDLGKKGKCFLFMARPAPLRGQKGLQVGQEKHILSLEFFTTFTIVESRPEDAEMEHTCHVFKQALRHRLGIRVEYLHFRQTQAARPSQYGLKRMNTCSSQSQSGNKLRRYYLEISTECS